MVIEALACGAGGDIPAGAASEIVDTGWVSARGRRVRGSASRRAIAVPKRLRRFTVASMVRKYVAVGDLVRQAGRRLNRRE